MSTKPNPYKRVPGIGMDVYEYARLYMADDHLMLVGLSAWNESYRRFFFRDIQAIVVRKTQWWILYGASWLLAFFLFAAIALAVDDVASIVFWGIASVFIVGLVVNIVRGPTCGCYIKTAVQTTRLAPLGRIRRARSFLDQLRPIIARTQGQIPTPPADVPPVVNESFTPQPPGPSTGP